MKIYVKVCIFFCFTTIVSVFSLQTFAQTKVDSLNYNFWEPPRKLSKKRLLSVSTISTLAYGSTMYSLNKYWYASFEKSPFHFYNDFGEWNQMDKMGHCWTAYAESHYMYGLYKWTGVKDEKAVLIGGVLGWTFQASIELLDGYSEKWGASIPDLAANTLGSAIFVSQQLIWKEQKFKIKFSSHVAKYDQQELAIRNRVLDLYGSSLSEKLLKDYNAQTYWLSFNPFHFNANSQSRFPKWLDLSVGYGVDDIYGGYENIWTLQETEFDFSQIERKRQLFLSLDIDWTKIKTQSKLVNVLLKGLNIFKFPAPALQLNNSKNLKFHWIYF